MEASIAAAKRITRVLFLSQSLLFSGLIATATVNAIVVADLAQSDSLAGIPNAIMQTSAAMSALLWGMLMAAIGRRRGLALGLTLGTAGVMLGAITVHFSLLPLFLISLFFSGIGMAAMRLSRFIAGDVHPPSQRGQAIATVVLGGTIGSIAGPALVGPAGTLALSLGTAELVGPYLASLFLSGAAVLLILLALKPDPDHLALAVGRASQGAEFAPLKSSPISRTLRRPGVVLATGAMVISTLVMQSIMVLTSLHIRNLGHALSSVAQVIGVHTLGMFAFAILSGRLADHFGRSAVIAAGGLTLALASALAGAALTIPALALALFLLGLGWNLCYVGGSALLSDHLLVEEQTRIQGANDLIISLVAAAGTAASGFLFATYGYPLITTLGLVVALSLPLMALRWKRRGRLTHGQSTG